MNKKERLDKVLANMGYGSRKDVKKIIKEGRVEINQKIIVKNDYKIDPYKDEIKFDGQEIFYRKYIYIMMNKPKDVVSSTDDPVNRTVLELLDEEYLIFNPFPAGRLDKDTEGLLILTNDGKLAHELLSPKKGVDKTYYVEVDGYVDEKHKKIFKEGIVLDDGYKTLPAKLEIIESNYISKVELTIKEGKFHQVKRMFQALDMEVTYLKRISMGPINLDKSLGLGEYRELDDKEIKRLKEKN
ncbi:pseudouridine synthase [Schnuerera sp.]|uniref:pseudouridine synthase n=1 Tax=Schnuerera sp. TaxID=2794844 RepID=UPI002C58BFB6|nr:pseudouridine synthase [Schnuerera sp.]HSH35197.1 pseudouridine synthase [Schnuerera sp.]